MKIAVIGAGAIGSVVAGYLTKAGVDVALIGKPEQVEVLRRDGLRLKGARGVETIKINALPKLDKEYGLVIFTVKTTDLEKAYAHNTEFLGHAKILTTQNGVQADNILAEGLSGVHFDKEKMFSSIVMFGATCLRAGEVTFNFEGDWIIGKPYTPVDPQTEEIADCLRKAFSVVIASDIMGMKWLKLFVNFNNCLPALIGKSMQETFSDMDFCRLSIVLLKEGLEAVKRGGIELVSLPQFPAERIFGLAAMPLEQAAGIIHKTLTTLSKEPLYGSILQSIMRQRSSEIDFINGEIVLLARYCRMSVPLNEKVVDMVHEVERKGKFFDVMDVKERFGLIQSVNK